MSRIDETTIVLIRAQLESAAEQIRRLTGVAVTVGCITYNGTDFKTKVTGLLEGAESTEESLYRHMYSLGRINKDLGTVFKWEGQLYQIAGWKKRAPKRPVICISMNNTRFNFPVSIVDRAELIRVCD